MSNSPGSAAELDHARIVADIEAWDAITDHRTGTAGDAATDGWLAAEIEQAGIEATTVHYGFERIDVNDCWVEHAGQRIAGVPMFDGAATGPQPVCGRAGEDIRVTSCTPFDAHELTRATQSARNDPSLRAIVAVSAALGVAPGLALLNAERYRTPAGPPVIQIGSEHAALLDAAASQSSELRVLADFARVPAHATNVQAAITGSDADVAPLVVMTPKSAWWTCTAERVGGIVVWLALLRHFAANPPRRTLMFTANSGHELSHLGLDRFLATHPQLLDPQVCWVHLGANFFARDGGARIQASDAAFFDQLERALATRGVAPASSTPVGERPVGEARNVHDGGGSYVSLLGSNPLFHHPQDRWPHSVDLDKGLAITAALIDLVSDLANA